tara:strand:+ start:55 stop:534 length:480 start_codon:yes stop_codon:yes gene_type:complete
MRNEMKKSLFYLFLCLLCGSSMNIAATVEVPDFRSVPWNERIYKTNLPQGFGNVVVYVLSRGEEKVESIWIEALGEKMPVPFGELIGIEQLGEPDLAIVNEGSENEKLQILFEYGTPIRVKVDSSSSCNANCSDWVRQVLAITINRKGEFEVAKKIPGS